jgi:hypothetical protein
MHNPQEEELRAQQAKQEQRQASQAQQTQLLQGEQRRPSHAQQAATSTSLPPKTIPASNMREVTGTCCDQYFKCGAISSSLVHKRGAGNAHTSPKSGGHEIALDIIANDFDSVILCIPIGTSKH